MFQLSRPLRMGLIFFGVIAIAFGYTAGSWYFTTSRLNWSAQSIGVFQSPAEGMLSQIDRGWIGIQEARIINAGPETGPGGAPYIWFVVACVWADSRIDGSPVGSSTHDFDFPGTYFLETKEGWVQMPEGSALFVGFWMKVFNLAGDGGGQIIHESPSKPACVRKAG